MPDISPLGAGPLGPQGMCTLRMPGQRRPDSSEPLGDVLGAPPGAVPGSEAVSASPVNLSEVK